VGAGSLFLRDESFYFLTESVENHQLDKTSFRKLKLNRGARVEWIGVVLRKLESGWDLVIFNFEGVVEADQVEAACCAN